MSEAALRLLEQVVGKPDGPRVLYEAWTSRRIGDSDLAELIPDTWLYNDSSEPTIGSIRWVEMFRAAGFLLRPTNGTRPVDAVNVYRGATRERTYGMSWTTNQDTAKQFARRHEQIGISHLYRALAPLDAILARFERPGEGQEFVLDPEGLELTVELLHRTEHAEEIQARGFEPSAWNDRGGEGVWSGSNYKATLTGHGEWVLAIEVPETRLEEFRVADPTGPYPDLFFLPDNVANEFPVLRVEHSPRSS
jgi:hypothetical protein